MIRIRTLGSIDLRSAEDGELRQVLAQPKRFALLVYLVVAGRGAFHRRDTLFTLFWPESDAERARSSLRTGLHFLRRALGAGVIAGRGTEEVGIAPGAVWCDALAFEEALDAGRAAEALELYRGPLLAGFNLAGMADWERWLSGERERLRRRAVEAAESLAARAEEEGDVPAVARWSRRAAALDPEDEGTLRRLMQRLAAHGDRAGAIYAYEEFSKRLRADYVAEPSRQTRALADEIRRGAADPEPPAPVPESRADPPRGAEPARVSAVEPAPPAVPEAVPAPAPTPELAPIADVAPAPVASDIAVRPRIGRRWIAALAAVVLCAAVGAGIWRLREPAGRTAAGAAPEELVAVLPFAVYGRGEMAYLREGMVDLLSTKLDGAGDLRSVDARALLASLGSAAGPGAGGDAAARMGAKLFVMGSVVEAGPQLQLRAALYRRTPDGPSPQSDAVVEGARDSLPRLVDRLVAQLLAGRLTGPHARLQRTAVLTTPSVPALKAYLQGESEMRAGNYDAAKAALQRAVEEDTTFALAWYRLSVAVAGSGERTGEAARQAVRYAGRLEPYDRLLLQAWLASWEFRYADAERMYRQAVAARPDDVEAWSQLAHVLFHGAAPSGHSTAESRPAWERVLALEPDNVDAMGYLARIAMAERRLEDADTLLARALALNPEGDRALVWRGYRGILLDDRAALDAAVAGMRRVSDLAAWVIAWRMVEDTRDPLRARPMVETLLDPVRPARIRASGRVLLAHTEVARGRWRAARAQLDSAAELDPAMALQARTLFAVLPFVPVERTEVERVRAALLARSAGIADAPPGPEPQRAPTPHAELQLHALGLLEARRGDLAAALEYARRLDAFDPPTAGMRIRGPLLADGVRAHVAWLGGRPADGLAVIDSAWQEVDRKPEVFPYLLDSGHPRFLRAELLRMAGRHREALAWYGAVTEHFDKSIVYAAPVHLRTAEILDRLGRPAEAAAHYRRFVELWRECDPVLRPRVERARRRLQRLQP
ncbi:MAG TPA: BTAD domain-containing putative transcriptional regulator [Longimicrobium sp.]|jgi:DNA-binding SARP family transcriptional activator/tetratricopeptide (TPR) repeat protein